MFKVPNLKTFFFFNPVFAEYLFSVFLVKNHWYAPSVAEIKFLYLI